MRPVVVSTPSAAGTALAATSSGASSAVILDYHLAPFVTGIAVEYPTGTTATCQVEITLDDPAGTAFATSAVWYLNPAMTAMTSPTVGTIANGNGAPIAVRAVRLNNTAQSAGAPTMTVVMAGGIA